VCNFLDGFISSNARCVAFVSVCQLATFSPVLPVLIASPCEGAYEDVLFRLYWGWWRSCSACCLSNLCTT